MRRRPPVAASEGSSRFARCAGAQRASPFTARSLPLSQIRVAPAGRAAQQAEVAGAACRAGRRRRPSSRAAARSQEYSTPRARAVLPVPTAPVTPADDEGREICAMAEVTVIVLRLLRAAGQRVTLCDHANLRATNRRSRRPRIPCRSHGTEAEIEASQSPAAPRPPTPPGPNRPAPV